jgi:hypothetical protein
MTCNVWISERPGDLFQKIEFPVNIFGMAGERLPVLHATPRNFISLEEREYVVNDAGRISTRLKGPRFSQLRISPYQWLSLIKLFELSVSTRKSVKDLSLRGMTPLKSYELFRRFLVGDLSITDDLLKGEPEADKSYFGDRRKGQSGRVAGHKAIVFRVLERGRMVSVSIVTDVKAESLMNETVKNVRRGSTV